MRGFKRKRGTVGRRRRVGKKRKGNKLATVRAVKSLISRAEETKWLHFDYTQVVDNTVGFVNTVNAMAQGDTRVLRTGNRIENVGLRCTMTIEPNGGATQATRVRVMLVMDKQPNGAGITGGDLFPAGVAAANRFYADYNLNTIPRRYKVLWDRLFLLQNEIAGATAAGAIIQVGQQAKYLRKRFRFKSKTRYNEGNAGTVADIITPNISWVLFSSQAAAQAPLVSISYDFMFKDA